MCVHGVCIKNSYASLHLCSLFVRMYAHCSGSIICLHMHTSTSLHRFLLHWLTTLPPAQQSVLRKKVFRDLKDVLTKEYFRDKYRWWMLVDFLRRAALISVIVIFPRSSVSIQHVADYQVAMNEVKG